MKVVVAAVPGAGKTTTLQILSRLRGDVKIVNFGDYMFKVARERYGIRDRDEMRRKLSLEDYRKIQLEAAREISKLEGNVIIDTHLAIKTPRGYYPGMPREVVSILRPDVFVLLEFDPKDILERRLKDLRIKGPVKTSAGTVSEHRRREIESEEEIELHQQMNRYFAVAAASEVQATVKIIDLRRVPQSRSFEHAEVGAKYLAALFGGGDGGG